jgi:hypothetical protein|tara:strand:+ start:34254 stop:34865 length:612 start_codon:yes stop_codon:yes gene_type:complete
MSDQSTKVNTSKLEVWLILLIPIVGLLIFTFMYFSGFGIPETTTNKGDLIQPPRSIETVSVYDADDNEFIYNDGVHKWTVLIPAAGGCNVDCQTTLYFTRQMHAALGKYMNGLRRFYVTDQQNIAPATDALLTDEYPRLERFFVSSEQLEQLVGNVDGVDYRDGKTYFLIDPMGFVMMSYTDRHGLKDLLSDLKFLLKQSGES